MKKTTLYFKALANIAIYLVGVLILLLFVPKVLAFFLPFVIGLIISAIANPVAKFFEEKIKFKRKTSSAILIVLLIALIIFLGYLILSFLVKQIVGLAGAIPTLWPEWKASLDAFGQNVNELTKNLPEDVRQSLNNIGSSIETYMESFIKGLSSSDATSNIVAKISAGIGNIANVLIGVIMCVLSAYFFTVEHNSMVVGMEKILPKTAYGKCMAAYRGLKNAVGGYFKAQIQIEIWVYIITMIGLLIMRIDYAVVIALGIAVLDFLPFFGAGAVMVPWGIIFLVNGDYWLAAGMFITWGIGQLVRQLIQPKIVGDNVGVAPLPTLVLLYVGYKWIGVFGMVIAVPVAMIFISLYKEGLFLNLIRSIRILWDGISSFRRLSDSDNADNLNKESGEIQK